MAHPGGEAVAAHPVTHEPAGLGRREVRMVFSGLMLAMLLAALDQTIVATALPTITGDLGGLNHLSWVVTAYLLATTVVMPLYGKVGDVLGRKPAFQFAIVVFLIGSAASGWAHSMAELIAFRTLQGIGGGGLMIGAQAIIGDIVSPRERGRYIGLLGGVYGLASVVGPLAGGFLVDQLSWRWIFFVNLPVGVVALVVTAVALRQPATRIRSSIDYLGATLIAAAVTCLVLVTSLGGTTYPWSSAVIVGLAVGSVALGAAWLIAERHAAEPIVPLRLFRDPVFSVAGAISFVIGFSMLGAISFLPTFLQIVTGVTATGSGLLMLSLMGGLLVAAIGSGQLITRTGRYKLFPIAGTASAAAGLLLLSTMDAHTTRTAAAMYMVVFGVGIGLVMQVIVLAVQNSVPRGDLGVATSSVSFLRQIGSTVGVASFGALLTHRLSSQLAGGVPSQALSALGADLESITPQAVNHLPPEAAQHIVQAFANALPPIFGYLVPLVAVAFVLALMLKEKPLRTTAYLAAGRPQP
ncbi:MAG: MDR family MFS transporter [Egibacteraceae bacterium]